LHGKIERNPNGRLRRLAINALRRDRPMLFLLILDHYLPLA